MIGRCGRLAAAGAAALLAAACTVGPNYRRPDAPVPAQYREPLPATGTSPAEWKTAEPSDAISRGKWWEIFGDPVLNTLEEQVSISNQTIAQSEAQFRGARAAARIARADLFPVVTTNPSVTRGTSRSGSTAEGYETYRQMTVDRHAQGIVSGVDVAQAETQLYTTRVQLTDLALTRAQLEHAIAILTGRAPGDFRLDPVDAEQSAPPSVPVVLPSELLERRPRSPPRSGASLPPTRRSVSPRPRSSRGSS